MSVEIKGIAQLVQNFSEYPPRIVRACTVAVQMSQAAIVNDAKNDHPYVDRTQNLTHSIQPGIVEIRDDGVTAYVEARMPYASFVEFGTSRAAPYPFLTPAMYRELNNFKRNLARQINSIKVRGAA